MACGVESMPLKPVSSWSHNAKKDARIVDRMGDKTDGKTVRHRPCTNRGLKAVAYLFHDGNVGGNIGERLWFSGR